jgi:hypothetical protein
LDHSFDPQDFGLSAKGTLPANLQYIREPVEVARGVLAQQALLNLNGISVLRDPDPEELAALIDEVVRLRQQCAPEREAEIAAKAAMDNLRDRANRLLRMVRLYLQTMIEVADEWELRSLLRSYGYTFQDQPRAANPKNDLSIESTAMPSETEPLDEVAKFNEKTQVMSTCEAAVSKNEREKASDVKIEECFLRFGKLPVALSSVDFAKLSGASVSARSKKANGFKLSNKKCNQRTALCD